MDENLAAWSAIYELETEDVSDPWVGAANLVPPIAPAELDTMKSNVSQMVFVPRLVIVTPADRDPETARRAPIFERYFNSELQRIRQDGKTAIQNFKTVLHLGLLDGGGPCDILFSERKEPKLVVTQGPKVVDENVVLDDAGAPEQESTTTLIEETIREVTVTPRRLKEWYLNPDESTSIKTAAAQQSVLWMMESDMMEKVAEGTFRAECVEDVLVRLNSGTTDVAADPGGTYDKDAGGQIQIGQGQGSLTSEFFKNRGPARVVRTFSRQYDLNKDGKPEANIIWHHPDYPKLLGYVEYQYGNTNQWPTFMFAPFPRPDRPYGYSLIERLADIIADAAAGRNQRRNYIDLALMPILLERDGDQIRDQNRAFFPGARWSVENPSGPNQSLSWFTVPPLPPDSFADEGRLDVYVSKLTGQNAPALGAQSSARRSATESKQQMAATAVRAQDVAMEFRAFLNECIQFWYVLLKQYVAGTGSTATTFVPQDVAQASGGDAQTGPLTIDADIINRQYNITIAGMGDPTDAATLRSELMAAMGVALQSFPWISQDDELLYAWAEQFIDTFRWASPERFIGSAEQAKARKDAKAQLAQMQAQGQLPGAQPGAPGGQPHPNGQATPAGAPQ